MVLMFLVSCEDENKQLKNNNNKAHKICLHLHALPPPSCHPIHTKYLLLLSFCFFFLTCHGDPHATTIHCISLRHQGHSYHFSLTRRETQDATTVASKLNHAAYHAYVMPSEQAHQWDFYFQFLSRFVLIPALKYPSKSSIQRAHIITLFQCLLFTAKVLLFFKKMLFLLQVLKYMRKVINGNDISYHTLIHITHTTLY